MRVNDVRARIEAAVPALAGRLGNAGQFAQLVEANQVPQVTPAGFVLPAGIAGGRVEAMTGLFAQAVTESVEVVLAARVAGDPTGAAGLDELTPLIDTVIRTICGWVPPGALGDFHLDRAEIVGSKRDVVLFSIVFSVPDQLRFTPS